MIKYSTVLLLLALAECASAQDGTVDPAVALKLMRSSLAKLSAIQNSYGRYDCHSKVTVIGNIEGKEITNIVDRQFLISRSGAKLAMHFLPSKSGAKTKAGEAETAVVYNGSECFALRRNSPESPWVLAKFDRRDPRATFWELVGAYPEPFYPLTANSMSDSGEEFLPGTTFSIRSAAGQKDGLLLVNCNSERALAKGIIKKDNTLSLAPLYGYATVRSESKVATVHGEFGVQFARTLTGEGDGIRCPTMSFTMKDPKTGRVTQKQIFTFGSPSGEVVPDVEFTLDYYVIPEPTDPDAQRPTPYYSSWKFRTVIGVTCLGLFPLFRRLSSRRGN